MRLIKFFIFLLIITTSNTDAFLESIKEGHSVQLGPEAYFIKRFREGGSYQKGWLYGGRFTYERKRRFSPYLALEVIYAEGSAKGRTGGNDPLQSDLCDFDIESRLGYSFQAKHGLRQSFTPFIGYGYFHEKNYFVSPSLTECNFNTKFYHMLIGFLAEISTESFKFGLKGAARCMTYGRNTITADFLDESINQVIGNEWHYEINCPIDYFICKETENWRLRFMPYWKKRHFGEVEHLIANYKETKFYIKGINASVLYTF